MTALDIKTKLINTGMFVDNEFLDKYCELVSSNSHTKKEKFKTNCHRILPKNYYKLNNLTVDNSSDNLVNLLYKDHILAHYYLAKCCGESRFKYSMVNAMEHILGLSLKNNNPVNIEELNLDDYQELHELKCQEHSKLMKNRFSGDNNPAKKPGVGLKISKTKKGHVVTEETRNKISVKNLGRVQPEEERLKRRKSLMGKNVGAKNGMYGKIPWNKGRAWPEETRDKMRLAKRGRVRVHLEESID